jgi:hypothetical protein
MSGFLRISTRPIFVHREPTAEDYVMTGNEYLVAVTDTSQERSVYLPSAVTCFNRQFVIKDESGAAGTNAIIVRTTLGQTLDGQPFFVLGGDYNAITIYSNGSNWFIM